MTNCTTCGNQSWLCQQCKMDAIEDRHGTTADRDIDRWILRDDLWHASSAFDGQTHSCLCRDDISTPLEWSTEDLRYVPEEKDAPVCRECITKLEGPRSETVPEDATFARASQLRADGGTTITEGKLVDRAVREATDLVDAGDSTHVAIGYVVDEHELEHRRDDVLERVRDRDQRDEQLVTDGGRDQDEYYAVDETRAAVVDGPFTSKETAVEKAKDRSPDHIVTTEGSLELIALTSDTTIRWENDDVDVVTDGGHDLEDRQAFLAGDAHWCDIYLRSFDSLAELIHHNCEDNDPEQVAIADGGQDQDPGSIEKRLDEISKQAAIVKDDLEDVDPMTATAIKGYLGSIQSYASAVQFLLEYGSDATDDDDDDGTPIAVTDGGRPLHRANCEDCSWSFEDEDLVDVSDKMERHVRKEIGHDVDLERAVATDGGHCVDDADQTSLQSTLTNSIANPITEIADSATSATKTAVSPVRGISISTNPLIHPTRSPTNSAAATVNAKRRCQLPVTYRRSRVSSISSTPEKAVLLPVFRRYFESAQRSRETDTDQPVSNSENSTRTEGGETA